MTKSKNHSSSVVCLVVVLLSAAALACGYVELPVAAPTATAAPTPTWLPTWTNTPAAPTPPRWRPTATPTSTAEEEYYLGWMQGCLTAHLMLEMYYDMEFVRQVPLCRGFIEFYYSHDLFSTKQLPKGWEFPPPEEWRDETMHENAVPVPTRTPTPPRFPTPNLSGTGA